MKNRKCKYCCVLKKEHAIVCGYNGNRMRSCPGFECEHYKPTLLHRIYLRILVSRVERYIKKNLIEEEKVT